MIAGSAVACAVGLAVCLVGEGTGRLPLRAVGKIAASLAFVAWALAWGLPDAGPHGTSLFVGLLLSVAGDVALLWSDKRVFLVGIVAFLLAHVAYAVAFVQLGPVGWGVAAALVPLAGIAFAVRRWLGPHLGRMRLPVAAYVAAISAMVALAGGVAAAGGTARLVLLVGAVLFFTSDLFVARQRFVVATPVNRYVGLPLYYVAQLLLAWAGSAP